MNLFYTLMEAISVWLTNDVVGKKSSAKPNSVRRKQRGFRESEMIEIFWSILYWIGKDEKNHARKLSIT